VIGGMDWNAVSAISTAAAAATGIFVMILTYMLLRSTRDQVRQQRIASEAELMQRLMERFDALLNDNRRIHALWETYSADTPRRFVVAVNGGEPLMIGDTRSFENSRHNVSRFFVSIRRLVESDRLPEDVVVSALEAAAFRFFVERVDPLDQAIAGKFHDDTDRRFYLNLLARLQSASTEVIHKQSKGAN
jgi:hypothetical protein